jgi:hypothetical protein
VEKDSAAGRYTPAFFGKSAQLLVGKGVVKHSSSKEGKESAKRADEKEKATEAVEGLWPINHNSCYHKIQCLSSNK